MGIATDTDRIAGVKPQMDDTNKLAVSLYGKDAAAGDTSLVTTANGNLGVGVQTTAPLQDGWGNFAARLSVVAGGSIERFVVLLHQYNGQSWDRMRAVCEQTALASGQDTSGGRTSANLMNYNAKGITILLDVTAVNGTGSISEIDIQAKLANGYKTIGSWATLGIAATGQYVFQLAPGAASAGDFTAAPIQAFLPRKFRIKTVAATDAAGNDVTYSITVVYQN